MMRKGLIILLFWVFSVPAFAQNILLVAPSGGDYSDPAAALAAIGTTLPAATAGNRYLVRLAPGRYTVTTPVEMKAFVDLEGSGTETTLIRGQVGSSLAIPVDQQGIINAASRSEIRHLSVRNTWSATSAVGISVNGVQGSRISDVRTVARGNADDSSAWKYGMRILDSDNVRLDGVVTRAATDDPASCLGLAVRNSSVFINDSRMVGRECSLGLGLTADNGSRVTIRDSLLRGQGTLNGISASVSDNTAGSETRVTIRGSTLHGQVFAGTPPFAGLVTVNVAYSEFVSPVSVLGTASCIGSYDSSLAPLTSACAP